MSFTAGNNSAMDTTFPGSVRDFGREKASGKSVRFLQKCGRGVRMRIPGRIVLGLLLAFNSSLTFGADLFAGEASIARLIDETVACARREQRRAVRPAAIEIDLNAFVQNIRNVRKMLAPDTKLCLVMKSNAYGHGIENLLSTAIAAQPDCIAFTENHEIAIANARMRVLGSSVPILRLAPATLAEAVEAIVREWNVMELVGSVDQARLLSVVATRLSETTGTLVKVPIHINIDTGMGRMGIQRADDVQTILSLPGLDLRGIMMHFAQSDNMVEAGEKLTREQLRRFQEVITKAGIERPILRHTANSAATSRFPWSHMDMVRVGSLIYGDVSKDMDPDGVFLPVMKSFTSSVVLVMHEVPPGTSVGYDGEYVTWRGRQSTLATVKVGYNNGYPKNAHRNATEVLIGGRRYPVVGKVSMNLLVADITTHNRKKPVRIGDEVVLLGQQGKEVITMEELASKNNLSTYELLLRLGNSNDKRVNPAKARTVVARGSRNTSEIADIPRDCATGG